MGFKGVGAAVVLAAIGVSSEAAASSAYDLGVMLGCPNSCGSYSSATLSDGTYVENSDFGGAEEAGAVGGEHAAWGRLREARADYGNLGVSAAVYNYASGDGSPVVLVGATAAARFQELIYVESATLPIGTPTTLTRSFEVTVAQAGPGWNENFNLDGIGGAGAYHTAQAGGMFTLNGVEYSLSANVGAFSVTESIPTFVGANVAIDAMLQADALVYRPFTYATGMVSIGFYAYHSAHVYMEASDGDVTLRAASGHDYTPPALSGGDAVPEPATWAMMILGFGLAGQGLRRSPRPAIFVLGEPGAVADLA